MTTTTRTADTIRAELSAAMSAPRRNRKLVDELTWDLDRATADRATATDAANARRADMGLAPFAGMVR